MTVESPRADISAKLLPLLTRHLRRIPPDVDWTAAKLSDLGLDSMRAIELVLDIEADFGLQFDDQLLVRETFGTFASLEHVVAALVARGE
jgi:acyl carrier protein